MSQAESIGVEVPSGMLGPYLGAHCLLSLGR